MSARSTYEERAVVADWLLMNGFLEEVAELFGNYSWKYRREPKDRRERVVTLRVLPEGRSHDYVLGMGREDDFGWVGGERLLGGLMKDFENSPWGRLRWGVRYSYVYSDDRGGVSDAYYIYFEPERG